MNTTTSKEATEAFDRTIRDILDECFGDTIILEPIVVNPSHDLCDDQYIEVYSVYSRDPNELDPDWQLALDKCVRPDLEELRASPNLHFRFMPGSKWSGPPWGPCPLPTNATTPRTEYLEIFRRRHHDHGDERFLLKAVSESVTRVTHRDQTGYVGIGREWEDASRPYTTTRRHPGRSGPLSHAGRTVVSAVWRDAPRPARGGREERQGGAVPGVGRYGPACVSRRDAQPACMPTDVGLRA